jgi:hypothetical protein
LDQLNRSAEVSWSNERHSHCGWRWYPHVLGIGIDDDAAILVRKNIFEVIGTGRVAIYDNVRRDGSWYYWLKPGDHFDLSTWTKLKP